MCTGQLDGLDLNAITGDVSKVERGSAKMSRTINALQKLGRRIKFASNARSSLAVQTYVCCECGRIMKHMKRSGTKFVLFSVCCLFDIFVVIGV